MKRNVLLLFVFVIFFFIVAEVFAGTDYYELEPGIYKVGTDIPSGTYDIRFNGLNDFVTISYSFALDEYGKPDLINYRSFSFTFRSTTDYWNAGGFLLNLYPGYIQIENSPCRFWIEK